MSIKDLATLSNDFSLNNYLVSCEISEESSCLVYIIVITHTHDCVERTFYLICAVCPLIISLGKRLIDTINLLRNQLISLLSSPQFPEQSHLDQSFSKTRQ